MGSVTDLNSRAPRRASEPVPDPIRILIVDDDAMWRRGTQTFALPQAEFVFVGQAQGRADAIAVAATEQPDIILLDINLDGENAFDFLPELKSVADHARMIIITGALREGDYKRALESDVAGLILKSEVFGFLAKAVRKVHAGEVWFSRSEMAHEWFARDRRRNDPEAEKISQLTDGEGRLISLIAEGLHNRQIAELLCLSEGTVRNHLTVVYEKLGLEGRSQLILYASAHGLAAPPKSS